LDYPIGTRVEVRFERTLGVGCMWTRGVVAGHNPFLLKKSDGKTFIIMPSQDVRVPKFADDNKMQCESCKFAKWDSHNSDDGVCLWKESFIVSASTQLPFERDSMVHYGGGLICRKDGAKWPGENCKVFQPNKHLKDD